MTRKIRTQEMHMCGAVHNYYAANDTEVGFRVAVTNSFGQTEGELEVFNPLTLSWEKSAFVDIAEATTFLSGLGYALVEYDPDYVYPAELDEETIYWTTEREVAALRNHPSNDSRKAKGGVVSDETASAVLDAVRV
jgi:hypothetical protein